ncbi:MAG TPA: peroxide stress protein YaaA [Miltoncostaeaceae bacterium]|nr:peroxide stress protein YaaA [Miltoncostaeaceae bacterium]
MLLLPPSQGKAGGGDGPSWRRSAHTFAALNPHRTEVVHAVRAALVAPQDGGQRLLDARGATLERARTAWEELDRAPTLPVWRRYSGVVWEALVPPRPTAAQIRALDERVLVISALWGLLAGADRIPDYRLKMTAPLAPLGRPAAFWRPHIGAALDAHADDRWVIDLLAREQAAALDPRALRRARLCHIELVRNLADGHRRAAGHAGKQAKGRLAQAILRTGAHRPQDIADLEVPGLRAVSVRVDALDAQVTFALSATR